MGSSDRRARDTDRDLAVDFVEAAWADGQLTREEYDVRVDRLLRATRLSELEQEVRDLQGPDGQAWVPGAPVLPHPVSPVVDLIFRGLSRSEVNRERRERHEMLKLLVAGVVALASTLAYLVWPEAFGEDRAKSEAPVGALAQPVVSALHASGFRELVGALEAQGATEVFHAQLTKRGARVIAAQHPRDGGAVTYEWDGGTLDPTASTGFDGPRLDVTTIDPVTVERATVATSAVHGSGPANEVVLTLAVQELDGEQVCVVGELSPPPASGYRPMPVAYDCQGRRVR